MDRTPGASLYSGHRGDLYQHSIRPDQRCGEGLRHKDAGLKCPAPPDTIRGIGMKTLYLAWQDPEDRRWLPVGRLSFDGHVYRFVYTKGAEQSPRFVPFGAMR